MAEEQVHAIPTIERREKGRAPGRSRRRVWLAIVLLTAAVFLLDLATPVGYAEWLLYLVPLLLTAWTRERWHAPAVAGACTVLVAAGFFVSPAGISLRIGAFNRLMDIGALWIAASLLMWRKRAEEGRWRSAMLLEEAQEIAQLGSWEIDAATGAQTWSAQMYRLFDRDPALGPPTLAEGLELLHPEDREPALKAYEENLRSGGRLCLEVRSNPQLGPVRYFNLVAEAIPDKSGRVARTAGTLLDITERKEAEAALREKDERLRLAAERSNTGLWDWDLRTNEVYFSPVWKRQIGYEDNEIPNRFEEWQRRVHPDDLERALATVRAFIAKPWPDFENEFRFRHKDGSYRWILAKASLVNDEAGRPVRMLGSHLDVTERERAEEALRESESKFRAVAETAACALFLCDATHFLYVNQASETISGYTRQELLCMSPFDVVRPDYREMVRNRVAARLRGESVPTSVETPIVTKGGAVRWLDFRVTVIPYEGRLAVLATAFDITERKRAEAALQDSEVSYRDLVENIQDLICTHDLEGKILSANRAAACMLGYEPSELTGMNLREILDPKVQEQFDQYLATILREGRASGLMLVRTRGGERRIWEYNNTLRTDGVARPIVRGFAQDITERKQAEKALHQSEERFRSLVTATAQIVWSTDADGKVSGPLSQWQAYTGQTEEQVRGDGWTQALHPDDVARVLEVWKAATRERKLYDVEYRLRMHDGSYRWVAARGVPVLGEHGIREWVGTCTDIQERKEAEQVQSVLYRISEHAASDEGLPQLFASVHGLVSELMYARNFYIALYDAATGVLSFPYFADEEDTVPPSPRRLGAGLTEYVLRRGTALLASPQVFEGLARGGEVEIMGAPSVDWMGAPLKAGETTIGVIAVQSYSEDVRYTAKQKDVLTFVAEHVATAIARQQTRQKLRESERKYRMLFERNLAGVFRSTREGHLLDCNPAFARIFGYDSSEEMLALPALDLYVHPEDRQEFLALLDRDGSVAQFESQMRKRDGSTVWIMETTRLVPPGDGNPVTIEGSIIDITERRRAEENLRRSEADLRSLVENAPYGIYRSDISGARFLMVNPALVRMLGYGSAAEVLALDVRELYQTPKDRAELIEKMRAGEGSRGVEVKWKRKDGKKLVVRASGRLYRSSSGQACSEMMVEDITQHQLLEEQFQQAQKMEAVGRLAGGVAHDFNNLLMIIGSFTELATAAGGLSEKQQHYLEEVRLAARRAAGVTQQLLAFSRKQVLNPTVLDLNQLLEAWRHTLPRLVGEDIAIELAPGKELGRVKADSGQLDQIIMNLAVNARDAMPGGGHLRIETANMELDAEFAQRHPPTVPGRYVMIAVTDSGMGMDEATQAHIFEPFFTTKERGKGTGLGLSTVYGIVKQSGGFIWVYSEPGHGTTFKIYLPRVEEPAPAEETRRIKEPVAAATETILLVEDEEGLRMALGESLEARGYRVLAAENGTAALRLLESGSPGVDVLLTDVIMPDMTGPELSRRVLELRPTMPVLYMSGYTDRALSTDYPGVKAPILQKPFSTETLCVALRKVLRSKPAAEPKPH